MATKRKSTPRPPSPTQPPATDYRRSYVRLRTQLDAMEIAVLRYYMEGEDAAEMERRAQELEEMIMPVITRLKRGLAQACPGGLNNCGGCCVPYPCPRDV